MLLKKVTSRLCPVNTTKFDDKMCIFKKGDKIDMEIIIF